MKPEGVPLRSIVIYATVDTTVTTAAMAQKMVEQGQVVLEMQPLEELPLIAKNGSPANGATALGPKPFAAH